MVTRFHLKIIAIVTMFIDHLAAVFYPVLYSENDFMLSDYYMLMRNIGRIAFPIFLFLFVVGYYQTKNRKIILRNLFIFALISEIPFLLAFKEPSHHNVMWTFLIIGISLSIWDYFKKFHPFIIYLSWLLLALVTSFVAGFCGVDYEFIAVIMAYLIALFPHSQLLAAITVFVGGIVQNNLMYAFASFSCIFILLVNLKKESPRLKYFFYIFYPAHLIVLVLLREILFGG